MGEDSPSEIQPSVSEAQNKDSLLGFSHRNHRGLGVFSAGLGCLSQTAPIRANRHFILVPPSSFRQNQSPRRTGMRGGGEGLRMAGQDGGTEQEDRGWED